MPSNAILEQKKQVVADLAEQIKASASGVVVNYQGLTHFICNLLYAFPSINGE